MSEWRDIETAPRDGTHVVVFEPRKTPVVAYFSQAIEMFSNLGWQSTPGGCRYNPTHWMPLPSPPGEAKGQDQ